MLNNGYVPPKKDGFLTSKIPKYRSQTVAVPLEMGSCFNCGKTSRDIYSARWIFFILVLKIGFW